MIKKNWKKIILVNTGVIATVAAIWYTFFGLKPYSITPEQLKQTYSYQKKDVNIELKKLDNENFSLEYNSFDGSRVNGQLVFPNNYDPTKPIPILIGMHGMKRSYVRWIQASLKDKETVEQTDEITNMALAKGYAVIAIDARNHGKRKNLNYSIDDLWQDLFLWGKREPYEEMIIGTIKDHRILLDWIEKQPQFDQKRIAVAGYSMGGQSSLILAAMDKRIEKVLSIVPPHSTNAVARVAPKNIVGMLDVNKIWLVTGDDDEYASESENVELFDAIVSQFKRHIVIEGGHILPEGYYKKLQGWY